MADRFRAFYTNDRESNPQRGAAHEVVERFQHSLEGNITADTTAIILVVPTGYVGRIVEIVGFTEERGVDGSNPLQLVYTIKKNTTAVATTDPVITKAAAAGLLSTLVTATGVTPAVIKPGTEPELAAGDIIQITYDITRTASPGTEIKGVGVQIGIKWRIS